MEAVTASSAQGEGGCMARPRGPTELSGYVRGQVQAGEGSRGTRVAQKWWLNHPEVTRAGPGKDFPDLAWRLPLLVLGVSWPNGQRDPSSFVSLQPSYTTALFTAGCCGHRPLEQDSAFMLQQSERVCQHPLLPPPPGYSYKPGRRHSGDIPPRFKGFPVFSKWLQIRGRLQTGAGLERRGHQGVWEKTDLPLIVFKISVIPSGN